MSWQQCGLICLVPTHKGIGVQDFFAREGKWDAQTDALLPLILLGECVLKVLFRMGGGVTSARGDTMYQSTPCKGQGLCCKGPADILLSSPSLDRSNIMWSALRSSLYTDHLSNM